MAAQSVWIVQHDETPHNTVLGVFDSADEAYEFAEQVKSGWPDGVITTEFEIGYRFTDNTAVIRVSEE